MGVIHCTSVRRVELGLGYVEISMARAYQCGTGSEGRWLENSDLAIFC